MNDVDADPKDKPTEEHKPLVPSFGSLPEDKPAEEKPVEAEEPKPSESKPIFSQPEPKMPDPLNVPTPTFHAPAPAQTSQNVLFETKRSTYLPEYFVMLVLLAMIVGAITTLIGTGIDSLVPNTEAAKSSSYDYSSGINTVELALSLSTLIASVPLFAVLFLRTRKTESATPEVKSHRWRRGFLGAFLVYEVLAIVWAVGTMFYDFIVRSLGDDSSVFSYFSSGATDPWWQVLITTILSVIIMGFVVFAMSRDYGGEER